MDGTVRLGQRFGFDSMSTAELIGGNNKSFDCRRRRCAAGAGLPDRCPIIGSPPPRKVFPGRQFTGKNPPRPVAARAGRIFTGKLSAGENFLWGAFL